MKCTILIVIGALAIAAGAYVASRFSQNPALAQSAIAETAPQENATQPPPAAVPVASTPTAKPHAAGFDPGPVSGPTPPAPAGAANSVNEMPPACRQAVEALVSPQAAFEEKQMAFKQLKDSGRLDQAISELEQRANANPKAVEYPAALGQAYLQKAGTLSDVREQGVLGLKADQTFEGALQLDPSNWDARFWKTCAMTYWPPQLGKGQEVIENFTELIRQQENLPAQTHFAQTYVMLGEQYAKQGNPDYAKQVWQRGAAFYPNDRQLAAKLTAPGK